MRTLAAAQTMRRRAPSCLLLLLLTLFAPLGLLGAVPESALAPPTVVVYPLTSTGQNGAETGSNVSIVLATKLAELGGLSVKPSTPGTARPQFLDAARKEGADYYVTGFMTPVGAEVSLIVQVVSTTSGSVVYSTTTMARTYADAANQADAVRTAIVRHAGRGLPALGPPLPAASTSPNPSGSDVGSVNLSRAFGRKRRATASAQPAQAASAARPAASAAQPVPAASATPPARGAQATPASVAAVGDGNASPAGRRLIVAVGGPADAADRAYAATALGAALRQRGTSIGSLPVAADEVAAHVADLCKANAGTRTLYASTLALEPGPKNGANAIIDIAAYDCNGAPVERRHVVSTGATSRRSGAHAAIDRAAREAADALKKPAGAG